MKLTKFFNKEKLNTGRQANLDFLKAISVIFMVLCHSVIYLCQDYYSVAYSIANDFMGTLLGAAHAFMLIMGVGLVYGKRNSPKEIFIRGLKLFILGYLLNFFRLGIYCLIFNEIDYFWIYFLSADILPFVGVTLMLTALLKKLKFNNLIILLLAIVMSIVAPLFYSLQTGNNIIDSLICVLVPLGNMETFGFNLFSGYIFVAFGMVFADIISRIKNLDKFYSYSLIPSLILSIAYTFYYFLAPYGAHNDELYYYGCSIVNAIGLLCIDMFLMSIFYFISKKIDIKKLKVIPFLSKNITIIYVVHWLLLGPLVLALGMSSLAEVGLKWYYAYLVGIGLIVISCLITKAFLSIKTKIKNHNK